MGIGGSRSNDLRRATRQRDSARRPYVKERFLHKPEALRKEQGERRPLSRPKNPVLTGQQITRSEQCRVGAASS